MEKEQIESCGAACFKEYGTAAKQRETPLRDAATMSSETPESPPEKRPFFEQLMEHDYALIHLDASRAGVEVPSNLSGNPSLTLKLSYHFQGETTHDDEAIVSYLKFDGTYFRCVIPWSAVWGMTGSRQEHVVWPQDLPFDVVKRLAIAKLGELTGKVFSLGKGDPSAEADQPKPSKPPRVLAAAPQRAEAHVEADTSDVEKAAAASETEDDKPARTKPKLTRVK